MDTVVDVDPHTQFSSMHRICSTMAVAVTPLRVRDCDAGGSHISVWCLHLSNRTPGMFCCPSLVSAAGQVPWPRTA